MVGKFVHHRRPDMSQEGPPRVTDPFQRPPENSDDVRMVIAIPLPRQGDSGKQPQQQGTVPNGPAFFEPFVIVAGRLFFHIHGHVLEVL